MCIYITQSTRGSVAESVAESFTCSHKRRVPKALLRENHAPMALIDLQRCGLSGQGAPRWHHLTSAQSWGSLRFCRCNAHQTLCVYVCVCVCVQECVSGVCECLSVHLYIFEYMCVYERVCVPVCVCGWFAFSYQKGK